MRDDDLRNRSFQKNVPPYQALTQGQNSSRNNLQQSIRQTRQVQPGNELRRVLRPGAPLPDLPDLLFGQALFFSDNDHRIITYYYTPDAKAADPMRDPPPGSNDNTWSVSPEHKIGILPASSARIIPEFYFGQYDPSPNYTQTCKIELLDFDDNPIASFNYGATVTGDSAFTTCTYDDSTPPDFGLNTLVEQFYGIRLTWVGGPEEVNHSGVAVNWLVPSANQGPDFILKPAFPHGFTILTGHRSPYEIYYELKYDEVPGLTDNFINVTDEDFQTGIMWADPSNHNVKFPWHYVDHYRLRATPFFWVNWLSFRETFPADGPFAIFSAIDWSIVTVDASGADVDELSLFAPNGISVSGQGFESYSGNDKQTDEACGFYIKVSQRIYGDDTIPTESNIIDLFKPFRIFWRTEYTLPPDP